MRFSTAVRQCFIIIIIKQIDIIVQQRFGKKFKLIPNIIIYRIKSKVVNYASNFLWSKLIRVIWITPRLLAERKPWNEITLWIFFT